MYLTVASHKDFKQLHTWFNYCIRECAAFAATATSDCASHNWWLQYASDINFSSTEKKKKKKKNWDFKFQEHLWSVWRNAKVHGTEQHVCYVHSSTVGWWQMCLGVNIMGYAYIWNEMMRGEDESCGPNSELSSWVCAKCFSQCLQCHQNNYANTIECEWAAVNSLAWTWTSLALC